MDCGRGGDTESSLRLALQGKGRDCPNSLGIGEVWQRETASLEKIFAVGPDLATATGAA